MDLVVAQMVSTNCTARLLARIVAARDSGLASSASRIGQISSYNSRHTALSTITVYGMRFALLKMVGGGVIINTASVSGLAADYMLGAYNAAKAGVINPTRTGCD
jgi:NAD(P)-dependent dehydrogenase (short-subunit alcohol dehydrogenase family)